jgi:hypothetical protein
MIEEGKKARSAKGLDISSKSEDPILPCNNNHTHTQTIKDIVVVFSHRV